MCVCNSLTIQINRFNSLTTPIAIDVIVVFEDLTLAAGHLVQVRTFYLTQTQISCLHVKANFPGRILFSRENFSSCFHVKRYLIGAPVVAKACWLRTCCCTCPLTDAPVVE